MNDVQQAGRSDEPESADADEQVMDLLAEHVPLALLVDLLTPQGPPSADILASEGMPDAAWWEPEGAPAAEPTAVPTAEAGAAEPPAAPEA